MSRLAHFEFGYISRAHGLAGEIVVRTFDPGSQALEEAGRVVLRFKDGTARELSIEHAKGKPGEWIVKFAGVTNRTEAEQLVGAAVAVFREDLKPPGEAEYFQGDLIGLEAVDEGGAVLGKVEEVWNTGPVPNLVIRGPGRPELLVPFADDFVQSVDLAAGRVVLRPPEIIE